MRPGCCEDTPGGPSGVWDKASLLDKEKDKERYDIKLSHPVPVIWVYLTGWANEDGVVNFRNDVYGLDPAAEANAARRRRRAPKRKRRAVDRRRSSTPAATSARRSRTIFDFLRNALSAPRPLQNRVDPFGELWATPERGRLMGNRGGRFHDEAQRIGRRRWASKQWIACVCEFKGRRREVFGRGYTELFFRDEPTALAAGHRPCFECRRAEAQAFQAAFPGVAPRAPAMDARLHAERLDPDAAEANASRSTTAGRGDGCYGAGRRISWRRGRLWPLEFWRLRRRRAAAARRGRRADAAVDPGGAAGGLSTASGRDAAGVTRRRRSIMFL